MYRSERTAGKWLSKIQFYFLGCILGWLWEVTFYWFTHSPQVGFVTVITQLRGFLHGPWVPIYGAGCVLMLLLRDYFPEKPIHFFISSVAVCGIMEFFTSWFLELYFHARWWDYSARFMNLDGRICLFGLLFFGLAGLLLVYVLEPAFHRIMQRCSVWSQKVLCIALGMLFAMDIFFSFTAPNLGIGVLISN